MINKNYIYIHYKNGLAYEVIDCENIYIQENGEWKRGVRYKRYKSKDKKEFVRTIDEFKLKFMPYRIKKYENFAS